MATRMAMTTTTKKKISRRVPAGTVAAAVTFGRRRRCACKMINAEAAVRIRVPRELSRGLVITPLTDRCYMHADGGDSPQLRRRARRSRRGRGRRRRRRISRKRSRSSASCSTARTVLDYTSRWGSSSKASPRRARGRASTSSTGSSSRFYLWSAQQDAVTIQRAVAARKSEDGSSSKASETANRFRTANGLHHDEPWVRRPLRAAG